MYKQKNKRTLNDTHQRSHTVAQWVVAQSWIRPHSQHAELDSTPSVRHWNHPLHHLALWLFLPDFPHQSETFTMGSYSSPRNISDSRPLSSYKDFIYWKAYCFIFGEIARVRWHFSYIKQSVLSCAEDSFCLSINLPPSWEHLGFFFQESPSSQFQWEVQS